ncbi:hypothetical protein IMZ16_01985 [Cruoricaptor ignavus]|uniref:DUF5683 domain-containing protein n=1 Tax=Cruoricaptor ignavus TaxID=1118202 RepID=A0A7M1T333_9FLAO|nr:hypothetical protein IMZ16_01985 [Cruoricaptor ignavus]
MRLLIFLIFFSGFAYSQVRPNDSIRVDYRPADSLQALKKTEQAEEEILRANANTGPLRLNPTRAGLYSAVLPGLGQFYNKKYWKIPVVWGAVGAGVGIALWNDHQYHRYRNAFIAELNGQKHEFSDIKGVTADTLGRTQDRQKRNRDYAIGISGIIYILNIVDAVVDAHLYEQRHDPDLALKPAFFFNETSIKTTAAGLSLNYKF